MSNPDLKILFGYLEIVIYDEIQLDGERDMSKLVHNITITVFEKDDEKIPDHNEIFRYILPVDFTKEKVTVSVETVQGFRQQSIHIIRLKTLKNRHNKEVLNTIFSELQIRDKRKIGEQYLTRLNNEGYFFIRLKKKDILEKRFLLTESGNCYHIKIKLAGFPANFDQFVNAAKMLLDSYNCFKEIGGKD